MKRLILVILLLVGLSPVYSINLDSIRAIAYLEALIEARLQDRGIAGATMVLVKDGKIAAIKGFGYANYEDRIKVDPERTLFRIGSISKTFIWTALMQLESQGKLQLTDEVAEYLPKLEFNTREGDRPITILDLMNHTAGFEDKVIGLFSQEASSVRPLEELLNQPPPRRVRVAGEHSSYSNYGAALAARIVEVVSGRLWNDYVDSMILKPAGMRNTTFRQPVSDRMIKSLSTGYFTEADQLKPQPFEYVPMAAVGGASSTAADMARYMIMHLQNGMIDSVQVLSRSAARKMQKPSHRHHPRVNPMRHGFMDFSQNGMTVFGHGGDTFWFHSIMALFPEENMGLFLSFNTADTVQDPSKILYFSVLSDFIDFMFPDDPLTPIRVPDSLLNKYAGQYEMNRYSHSSLTKIIKLAGVLEVVPKDGIISTSMAGSEAHWSRVGEDVFQNVDDGQLIVFKVIDGKAEHLYMQLFPIFAFDRLSAIDSPGFHLLLFIACLVLMLLTLIFWPFAYFVRRGYRENRPQKLPLAAKYVAWINCLVYFIFLTLLGAGMANPFAIVYGVPSLIKTALILPFISIILLLFMGFMAAWIWREDYANRWSRFFYYILVVNFIVVVWQLNYWNFLGWNY